MQNTLNIMVNLRGQFKNKNYPTFRLFLSAFSRVLDVIIRYPVATEAQLPATGQFVSLQDAVFESLIFPSVNTEPLRLGKQLRFCFETLWLIIIV